MLGRPTATRAVARACATNPVCVLIPCHRVVREGGALGGYRWGIERKQALIDAERCLAGKKEIKTELNEQARNNETEGRH